MSFNPKWIIGKTVAKVDMRVFRKEEFGRSTATDPIIIFTDGSRITFTTQETEIGTYGTAINYYPSR